jgi:hypothetical protein
MNERIKQLAAQAWVDNDQLDAGGYTDLEKFAELIVKECLEILDGEDDYGYESRGVRIAAYRMKKYFEIEE